MGLFKRMGIILSANPNNEWEAGATFNATAIYENEKFYLYYRAIKSGYKPSVTGIGYDNYISYIGLAISNDGVKFERLPDPILEPSDDFDIYGCEDPRITKLEDKYYITYTALSAPAFSGKGNRVGLAVSNDLINFKKLGVMIPDVDDKDTVIFPEKINGKIVVFHRAFGKTIQIVEFESEEDLSNPKKDFWKKYFENFDKYVVMKPEFHWEGIKIGAGPAPIKTDIGWLFIYHGKGFDNVYRVGGAILDLENPQKIIYRSKIPLFEPEESYEKFGDVNNVVFPEGLVLKDDLIYMYYGAADKVVALAIAKLSDLVDFIIRNSV